MYISMGIELTSVLVIPDDQIFSMMAQTGGNIEIHDEGVNRFH